MRHLRVKAGGYALNGAERKRLPVCFGCSWATFKHYQGPMHCLLEAMGSPHRGLHTIHVAGTKGKGSTVAFLESILIESGYRVGGYTSPHVQNLSERLRVGGKEVGTDELDRLLVWMKERVMNSGLHPSHFEVMTALAFKHFHEAGVDVAILEAGLGAVTDATNVLDPHALELGVVTSIGLEHLGALGGNIESIAKAKSGVFKEGKIGVVGEQVEKAAEAVVLLDASEKRVKTYRVEAVVGYHVEAAEFHSENNTLKNSVAFQVPGEVANATFEGSEIKVEGDWEFEVQLSLVGRHQASNAATAVTSALALRANSGYDRISKDSIVAGLGRATLPGRFQVVSDVRQNEDARNGKRILTIVDGAHTKVSAKCLAETLRQLFPESKLAVVLAMASDKDHEGFCLEIQKSRPNVVVFTETSIAGMRTRSAGPGALVGAWQIAKMKNQDLERSWRCRELIQANMQSALAKARHELSGEASSEEAPCIILVTGSLHACDAASRAM